MDLQGFDASTVPEQADYSAIPPGSYPAIAIASEEKANSKGTGTYLQFTFEVLDGQYKGRKVWSRLNLNNPNQTAVDIAKRELGAICKAVGVIKPNRSEELHNKPLLLVVDVEVDDRGREQNIIKKYDPISGAPQAPAVPPTPAQAPAATPPAASVPPWKK